MIFLLTLQQFELNVIGNIHLKPEFNKVLNMILLT